MIGRYVKFKGDYYIVLKEVLSTGQVQLIDLSRNNYKIMCNVSNVELTDHWCKKVHYKNTWYLVTKKKLIVSLKSGRSMLWDDKNGDRKAVLDIANYISS